ncbi:MAG: poly(3-hydroxyalkanoate) depolymerase [Nocardioidaceae bacterium]|jgi:pimeloyl-ACP methyl ester carboxylesterase|nr:poly(3-hydroxyalkanoate) depolymerase [Nocardioidaceae bacterium]
MRVQGTGPPLLLLNGWTRPMASWEPFLAALSGRTLVTFDAPGVGASATPLLPLPMSVLAEIAAGVLDVVGLDEADVLGYSHGGVVAQRLALAAPERVRRLVLVATSCGLGATPGSAFALRALREPLEAHPWPRPNLVGAWWQSLAVAGWSSLPFLAAIRTPTLVVSGARDRVVPPLNSAVLARRIPGADLVLMRGGHDLQRRGPAGELAQVVEPFLTRDERVDLRHEQRPRTDKHAV